MMNAGLLDEVFKIYDSDAVYTQGLRQAIGVREFDKFFRLKVGFSTTTLDLHDDKLKSLLGEAVSELKANTRRLVRRQRRRLHRLNTDFRWNLHRVDAKEAFQCVPHHLLSMIDPSVEFTCRDFRDHAVPIIEDILDRGSLPVIVGGTNFYIQALVSPFLFDDMAEDMQGCTLSDHLDDIGSGYERLKDIDPVAAQRIHPNNHRKIKRYLELYATTGALPSDLFQGEAAEDKWGRPTNSRFQCCFLWVDADLRVLDSYVNERVDCMMNAGLLDEVCKIYDSDAVYTQGLRQAIGVCEFDKFFRLYLTKEEYDEIKAATLDLHDDNLKSLLSEAVSELKANTRRLVRRQRRRLHRLNTDFGWNLHRVDATEAFKCTTSDSWREKVVKPCVDIVKTFLSSYTTLASTDSPSAIGGPRALSRELWTQFVCEACNNRILRGAHEWEQHKQGRGHRKRVQSLKHKSKIKGAAFEVEA